MTIDIHQKASSLLESLANSIYDREQPRNTVHTGVFLFSITEVELVEKWLKDILAELERPHRDEL